MTYEEKQLLLKDLCARMPYDVRVSVSGGDFDNYQYPYLLTAISKFGQEILCKVYSPVYTPFGCPSIENVKPYLRPMSSMTEEEREEYYSIDARIQLDINGIEDGINLPNMEESDWLNEHHFDHWGMIPMGLALEAPEDMYKF